MPSGRDEWIAMAKAIYSRFGEVQLTDRAAAMTYYSILSLFPALLVVVSLLALMAVVVAGPLFGSIAEAAGFSDTVAGLVGYLRWPIGAAALLTAFAVV